MAARVSKDAKKGKELELGDFLWLLCYYIKIDFCIFCLCPIHREEKT